DQADALGGPRQRGHQGQRLQEPARPVGHIVRGLSVGKEDGVQLALFGQLGQFFVEAGVAQAFHLGIRMAPGGAVMAAAVYEQVEVQLSHPFFTSPPSTTRFCPVTARAQGPAKNSAASANSSGVVTRRSGVLAAIRSNTASGVAAEASVVRSRPPEIMLTVICCGPRSCDRVR